jgi:DEAD/DEAH box helicase
MASIPTNPNYSNVNNWNFNLLAPPLSAPSLPEPFYPEQNQDSNLDSLWPTLMETFPSSPFLPEAESQTAYFPLPAVSAPVVNALTAPPIDLSAANVNLLVVRKQQAANSPNVNRKQKNKKNDSNKQPRKKAKTNTGITIHAPQNHTISYTQPTEPPNRLHLTPPSIFSERPSEIKASLKYTPITYPFLDRFPKAEDVEPPILCYNSLLKPYQQREVSKLMHYNSKGVSRILALETGLGKTYIYGEFIAQRIASKTKGIHLVIVPKSILQSAHEDLKIVLGLGDAPALKICIDCCDNTASLNDTLNKLENPASVVVTTYEAAMGNHIELTKHTFSTLIVDEVHRLIGLSQESRTRSEKTEILCRLQSFIETVQPSGTAVVLVTSAPLQDSFEEIPRLLNLANPKAFDCDKLVQIHNLVVEKIIARSQHPIDSQNDAPLLADLIRSFAYFEAFKQQIVRPLIEFVQRDDTAVINDWKAYAPTSGGSIPIAQMTEKTRDLLRQAVFKEGTDLEGLKSHHAIRRILLHPDFAVDKIEKFNIPGIKEQISEKILMNPQWISDSPLLNTLVNFESWVETLQYGRKVLIVTEYMTIAKIVKKALQCKFAMQTSDVKIFHRNLSPEKKQQHLHWFNTPSPQASSKILILMRNVKNLGLNFSKNCDIFMTSMGWNHAKDEQAINRLLPLGGVSDRHVNWINYKVYPQNQSDVMRQKTCAWKKFFWNNRQGLDKQFQNWLCVLEKSCLQKKLNDSKNLDFDLVKASMKPIDHLTIIFYSASSKFLQQHTSDQLLQQTFDEHLQRAVETFDELSQRALDAFYPKRNGAKRDAAKRKAILKAVHPTIPSQVRTLSPAPAPVPSQVRTLSPAPPPVRTFSPAPVPPQVRNFSPFPAPIPVPSQVRNFSPFPAPIPVPSQVRNFPPSPVPVLQQFHAFSSAPPPVRTFSPAPAPPQVRTSPPPPIQSLPMDEIARTRYTIIPLAEPDWSKQEKSYDKASKIGIAILNQRTQIRSGESLPQKYRTECFVYTDTDSIKLDSISNYSEPLILRLVKQERKKANGETYEHYDPVILNDNL